MKEIKEITLIIVGEWNIKIFTPIWMLNVLLDVKDKNEEINIGFTNNDLKLFYTYKNVTFAPSEKIFSIRFTDINDTTKEIATKAAIKLFSTLSYTPNIAVGFNYTVEQNYDVSNIELPFFNQFYKLNEIKLTKEENNFTVNVILNNNQKNIVSYNFHFNNDKLSFINENSINEHLNYLQSQWEQI